MSFDFARVGGVNNVVPSIPSRQWRPAFGLPLRSVEREDHRAAQLRALQRSDPALSHDDKGWAFPGAPDV